MKVKWNFGKNIMMSSHCVNELYYYQNVDVGFYVFTFNFVCFQLYVTFHAVSEYEPPGFCTFGKLTVIAFKVNL